jgi:hypothetical protein
VEQTVEHSSGYDKRLAELGLEAAMQLAGLSLLIDAGRVSERLFMGNEISPHLIKNIRNRIGDLETALSKIEAART